MAQGTFIVCRDVDDLMKCTLCNDSIAFLERLDATPGASLASSFFKSFFFFCHCALSLVTQTKQLMNSDILPCNFFMPGPHFGARMERHELAHDFLWSRREKISFKDPSSREAGKPLPKGNETH